MYSDDEQDFDNFVTEIREECNTFNNYVKSFDGNYNIREQWVTDCTD